jgi:hypothetical protein
VVGVGVRLRRQRGTGLAAVLGGFLQSLTFLLDDEPQTLDRYIWRTRLQQAHQRLVEPGAGSVPVSSG